MSLVGFRDSIRDRLAAGVKDLAEVRVHGGRLDLEELRRIAVKAPCAVVSPVAVRSVEIEGDQCVADLQWAVFLVAKDTKDLPRDAYALVLLEAALGVIRPDQRFGDAAAHMPTAIRAESLYTGKVDAVGLALWAITWAQLYDVNVVDISIFDDFLKYRSTWALEGATDDTPTSQDAVDLEPVEA